MSDLVEFLRARYGELEQAAKAPLAGHARSWRARGTEVMYPCQPWVDDADDRGLMRVAEAATCEDATHIALNDPAYVLADIASKRAILDEHQRRPDFKPEAIALYADKNLAAFASCARCYTINESASYDEDTHLSIDWPCLTLRLLAAPFAAHEQYDPAWAVPMS